MTVEEFEKKFAELTKKHDELEKKFNSSDFDGVFDNQGTLLSEMGDSIDKMLALVDKAMAEAENER